MIFSGALRKLDAKNVEKSLMIMENHIRSMQEQLEYTLYNLDSTNITSLDTGMTDITSGDGGISITGDCISLTGAAGERVLMGNQGDKFVLSIAGKGGQPAIYLNSRGAIAVGQQAEVSIDCGRWD